MTWQTAVRLALLCGLVLTCASPRMNTEPGPLARPVVDRISRDSLRIRWPEAFANGSTVRIYAGLSPDAIDRKHLLAATEEPEIELRHADGIPLLRASDRLYFELVRDSGAPPVVTAERRLPLQGPDNFRDLGGYEGWQGRPVRWGRLYRSNELAELTTSDLGYLSRLDVKLVCDFRSDGERKESPNPALFSSEEAGYWPAPVEQEGADGTTMRHQVRTGGITADWIHGVMLVAYRAFVTDHSPTWAAMFQRIARPENLPTVLHCTAGKDRTGFASALILFSLGVSEETVFEDYLATNHYRADFAAFVLRWIRLYSFFRTDPESLIPLLEARREYLQASIDEMNERYGSVDGYLRDGLGVTDELRASLRKNLLR